MRRAGLIAVLWAAGLGLAAADTPPASTPSPAAAPARDPRWATPLTRPGLRNLYQVSPTLLRGAQPSAEGLRSLKALGVKTVVSLRFFHSEEKEVQAAGLGQEHVPFELWHPSDDQLRRFLAVATDPARQPVYVHCQRGADRTGMAVAVYRICVEGWSKEDAVAEMRHGGFGFSPLWTDLVHHVQKLDVDKVCPAPSPAPAVPTPPTPPPPGSGGGRGERH